MSSTPDSRQEPPPWLHTVENQLDGLYQLDGVLYALLVKKDGTPLVVVPEDKESHRELTASLAALEGTAELAMQQSEGGAFLEGLIRGERTEILCVGIGEDAVLGIVAERGALTGLLFMAIQAAALQVERAVLDL